MRYFLGENYNSFSCLEKIENLFCKERREIALGFALPSLLGIHKKRSESAPASALNFPSSRTFRHGRCVHLPETSFARRQTRFLLRVFIVLLIGSAFYPWSVQANFKSKRDACYADQPGKLVGWGSCKVGNEILNLADDIPTGRAADGFIQVTGIAGTWGALRENGEVLVVRGVEPNLREVEGKIVKIGVHHGVTAALDDAGKGYLWARDDMVEIPPVAALENLADIELGNSQGYALTNDGKLIWWGRDRYIKPDFADKVAPFQGEIAWIASGGFGGSFITHSGKLVRWSNFGNQSFSVENDLSIEMEKPSFDSYDGRVGFLLETGGWRCFGDGTEGMALDPTDKILTVNRWCLAARSYSGIWTFYDDGKFPDIQLFRDFLRENRPDALLCLGQISNSVPEERALGAISIVPGSSTLPARTTVTPRSEDPSSVAESTSSVLPSDLPTDHGITDPRFTSLLEEYKANILAKSVNPFDASVSDLNAKLDAALSREENSAIEAGDLDRVTAFRSERKLLATGDLPAKDQDDLRPTIIRFRTVWRAEYAKIEAQRVIDSAPILEGFEKKLEELQIQLTTESKIDEALKLREFRKSLMPDTGGNGE